MPINLSKGQKVDLTKGNPGLTKIMVGLGWDVNAFDSGAAFDLDAAAFLLGANGKPLRGFGDLGGLGDLADKSAITLEVLRNGKKTIIRYDVQS